MIDALEILRQLRLPPADEQEVQRIGSEIIALLRPPKFDGRPVGFAVPVGANEEQQTRSTRIVCALQRRFQARGWTVHVGTATDAYGHPTAHQLTFMIDGAAVRNAPPSPAPAAPSVTSSLNTSTVQLPVQPTLSVILGTYNRRALLERAVMSVRTAAKGLAYEIVVVDGGSTDGSREWLAAQPDVLLVAERRLDGAVAAFNQAFALCRGNYVCNFNDDARYLEHALFDAVDYLDRHENANVGQVALGYGEGGFIINSVYPGSAYSTTYANFGVARRSVAEQVAVIQGGFWNPLYHTYAADVEFSCWVWKLGYRVAELLDAHVFDVLEDDALRERNRERYVVDTKIMYTRWPPAALRPDGPEPRVTEAELARYRQVSQGSAHVLGGPSSPAGSPAREGTGGGNIHDALAAMVELCGLPEPEEERRLRAIAPRVRALDPVEGRFPPRDGLPQHERVLHVSLATDADPQAGLCRALRELGGDGVDRYAQVDWTRIVDHEERQARILEAATVLKPTFVFMQLQEPGVVEVETVRKLRRISPGVVVASWCGDVGFYNSPWGVNAEGNLDWQVPLGRVVDLTLHSSMTHVRILRAAGIHTAGYLQIGYDERQYRPAPLGASLGRREYDVAFLGNGYANNDPFSLSMKKHDGDLRQALAIGMRLKFGKRFGLFGTGWGDDVKRVPLHKAHEVYRRSCIGLSVSLVNDLECYSSDRLLRILGCGAVALVKRFPGMSVWGLDETNCLVFDTAEQAVEMAQDYLRVDDVLKSHVADGGDKPNLPEIAAAGLKLVQDRHTWTARMSEIVPYICAVRAARETL